MIGAAAANTAIGAGSTVISLVWVMVLLQASVNVHVSVCVPPHPVVLEPVLTAVTVPEIRQLPDAELV